MGCSACVIPRRVERQGDAICTLWHGTWLIPARVVVFTPTEQRDEGVVEESALPHERLRYRVVIALIGTRVHFVDVGQ